MTRSLALLAAVFAIMVGTLLPFAAMAAVKPGQPIVLCTAEGPQTIHIGGLDGPVKGQIGAKCAACVMPAITALPPAPVIYTAPVRFKVTAKVPAPRQDEILPPSQGPPRPHSTAPPLF